MTISTSYLQAGTHSARMDRRVLETVSSEGVVGTTDLAVTEKASGANLSVDVAAGLAYVTGDGQSRDGRYLVELNAVENVAIGAPPGSDSRIDLVVLTIRNSEISGSDDDAIVQVVEGTAAASPVAPALPDSSIALAEVTVASGASTITDVRVLRSPLMAGVKLTAVDGDGQTQNINSASYVDLASLTIDTAASGTDDVWVAEFDFAITNASGGARTLSLSASVDGTAATIKPTIPINDGDSFDGRMTVRLRDKGTTVFEGTATYVGTLRISGGAYMGGGGVVTIPAGDTFEVAFAAKFDAATADTLATMKAGTLQRLVAP